MRRSAPGGRASPVYGNAAAPLVLVNQRMVQCDELVPWRPAAILALGGEGPAEGRPVRVPGGIHGMPRGRGSSPAWLLRTKENRASRPHNHAVDDSACMKQAISNECMPSRAAAVGSRRQCPDRPRSPGSPLPRAELGHWCGNSPTQEVSTRRGLYSHRSNEGVAARAAMMAATSLALKVSNCSSEAPSQHNDPPGDHPPDVYDLHAHGRVPSRNSSPEALFH